MNYVERYYLMNSSILIELIKLYFHRKQNLIKLRLTHLSWFQIISQYECFELHFRIITSNFVLYLNAQRFLCSIIHM